MSQEVLIKKYPNRCLYDTSRSEYITLDQVRAMVVAEVPIKVLEQKTGEDITRTILMQIIMEQESDGQPMFTLDMLMRFIRHNGTEAQQQFTDFISGSMHMFAEQQAEFADNMQKALKGTSMEYWVEMGEKQMKAWQDMQKSFLAGIQDSKEKK